MGTLIRYKMLLVISLLLINNPALFGRQSTKPVDSLLGRLQEAYQKKDYEAYLNFFSQELRQTELKSLNYYQTEYALDRLRFLVAGSAVLEDNRVQLFLQAYISNQISVLIETWLIVLQPQADGFVVVNKEIVGSVGPLYKIAIPSGKSIIAKHFEIRHKDMSLVFENAAVFYDNLPDFETALVVIGNGRFRFEPSDDKEKHQLELHYKKRILQTDVRSAYLRFSNYFFENNIKIDPAKKQRPVSGEEEREAARVFDRNYLRTYTIENPLQGEQFSFVPLGNEVIVEVESKKFGQLAYTYSPFSDEEISLFDRSKKRIISLYHPVEPEDSPGEKRLFVSFGEKFDVESYDLKLKYSIPDFNLISQVRINIRSRVDKLRSLRFRFNPDLEITGVSDGHGRKLFYTIDRLRKFLYVFLLTSASPNNNVIIDIAYKGKFSPPVPATDVIAQSGDQSRVIFKPRYDTYFFSAAGDWYPAPPEQDYFSCRLELEIPDGYNCIAIGQLEKNLSPEKNTFIFVTGSPVKYISFLIGKFELIKDISHPVPIQLFVSPELFDRRLELVDQAKEILDYYSSLFGPYPYEKLAIVVRLWPTAGGFSPPAYVILNEIPWQIQGSYPDLTNSPVSMPRFNDFFLAHEIGHQWWGHGVSFATYKDQWLSEGLSQFAALSFIRYKYGEKAFLQAIKKFASWVEKKSKMGSITLGSRLSFYDYDAYQAIIYNKAALVLFILEELLGQDVFNTGLKLFFEKYFTSSARTKNFIHIMEQVSNRDLENFFNKWFDSHELPGLFLSWSVERDNEQLRMRLHLNQTTGIFEYPLWVEWQEAGTLVRHKVIVNELMHDFSWSVQKKPSKFFVNPGRLVPGKFLLR